jgi:hypothetical protein
MRFKLELTRLQKIGIILSLLWAIGMGLKFHYDTIDRAQKSGDFVYNLCQDGKLYDRNNTENCDIERAKMITLGMEGDLVNSLLIALAPLPLFWITGFIIYYLWKIQIAGFQNVVQWPTLNKKKKTWVVFCFVFSFFVLLCCLVIYLRLIQERRVPVSLGLSVQVIPVGNDYVYATGTWTMLGLIDDTIMHPLQRSEIVCRKQTGECHESKAYVQDGLLGIDTKNYEIISWTSSSIVMKNELACGTELYTIDLNTKAVTGAGHLTNQNNPECQSTWGIKRATQRTEWKLQMEDGRKVWQEELKKASPYLLRLIQSFFGN